MNLGGTLKKWSLEKDMIAATVLALFPSAPCNGIALWGCLAMPYYSLETSSDFIAGV